LTDRYITVLEVTAKLFVSTAKGAKSYPLNLSCHDNFVISVQLGAKTKTYARILRPARKKVYNAHILGSLFCSNKNCIAMPLLFHTAPATVKESVIVWRASLFPADGRTRQVLSPIILTQLFPPRGQLEIYGYCFGDGQR
jgi:hypothetical protein